jgi:Monoamine oxidase
MSRQTTNAMSRRHLLTLIGKNLGAAAMMQGMGTLGFAATSTYAGPVRLDGAPKGTRVLVLGAGMAGLVAAFELRNAGYHVQVLEYNNRAGGRAWTVRGGDRYTELGGATQSCDFADGLYLNPGPWRIPYHHQGVLDYAKRLKVSLEPFIQVNYNATCIRQRLSMASRNDSGRCRPTIKAMSPSCFPKQSARMHSMMRCQPKMRICYSNPCANGVRSVGMGATRRPAKQ